MRGLPGAVKGRACGILDTRAASISPRDQAGWNPTPPADLPVKVRIPTLAYGRLRRADDELSIRRSCPWARDLGRSSARVASAPDVKVGSPFPPKASCLRAMSLLDAAWAIREAMKVLDVAEDMVAAGAIGDVVRDTLRHADELLDVADAEISDADLGRHQVLAAASPMLRAKLRVLRDRVDGPPR